MLNMVNLEVYFDDVNFTDLFEVYLIERPIIPIAEEGYEAISIPGSNRDLHIKSGYKTKPFDLVFSFVQKDNVKKKMREISNWLTDKKKLKFSDDNTVYRVIQTINFQDANSSMDGLADFVLQMNTEAFWYEPQENRTISTNSTITNPSKIPSELAMRINGNGVCRVLLNDNQMVFTDVVDHVMIEEGRAHKNMVSQDNKMSGKYPILLPGTNTISISGSTTSIELYIRWCWR